MGSGGRMERNMHGSLEIARDIVARAVARRINVFVPGTLALRTRAVRHSTLTAER